MRHPSVGMIGEPWFLCHFVSMVVFCSPYSAIIDPDLLSVYNERHGAVTAAAGEIHRQMRRKVRSDVTAVVSVTGEGRYNGRCTNQVCNDVLDLPRVLQTGVRSSPVNVLGIGQVMRQHREPPVEFT